jgi:hypothetical protein
MENELSRGSLNKLFEEWSNIAIAQYDAEARFAARAARGDVKRGDPFVGIGHILAKLRVLT